MSGFWDFVGKVGQFAAREKSGESYQMGYRDALQGRGKSPDYIRMKASADSPRITEEMRRCSYILIDAYQEGYKDGLEVKEMELRTQRNVRFRD